MNDCKCSDCFHSFSCRFSENSFCVAGYDDDRRCSDCSSFGSCGDCIFDYESKAALSGKLYRTFYDFFVNHGNDGTPFPDVGTIYCRDLLEYEKFGGDPASLCSDALSIAYWSFLRDIASVNYRSFAGSRDDFYPF